MQELFLLIGSNMGDRFLNMDRAKIHISEMIGEIISASGIYETEPWGMKETEWFLNQVLKIQTSLKPETVLSVIHGIEESMGRERKPGRYLSRTIDIDILFYESIIHVTPELIIPHPALHERLFTLIPLREIAPDFVHPIIGSTIEELIEECHDELKVKAVTLKKETLST